MEILEAPVPFICGVHRPVSQGQKFSLDSWCQETLIVLLDSGKIIRGGPQKNAKVTLPSLYEMEKVLNEPYESFVKSIGNRVETCYFTSSTQTKAVCEICNKIEVVMRRALLNYIPTVPQCTQNQEVDLEQIKITVKGFLKPLDESFFTRFCETQMFAIYIDEHFKEMIKKATK